MKVDCFRRFIKRCLWRSGWDVVRFNPSIHPLARRARLLQNYGISLTLDVGANAGQYATELRNLGYASRIVSFEPLTSAYRQLSAAAKGDPLWQTRHYALGTEDAAREIHVAGNSQSSSFLEMLPAHIRAFPDSEYVESENVCIRRLDSVFHEIAGPEDRIWLKIDTKGFEKMVINGAENVLPRIDVIQAEVSLQPGEATLADFVQFMAGKGFALMALAFLGDSVTSHLLQTECIFHRA